MNKDPLKNELTKLKLIKNMHIGVSIVEISLGGLNIADAFNNALPVNASARMLSGIAITCLALSHIPYINKYQDDINDIKRKIKK